MKKILIWFLSSIFAISLLFIILGFGIKATLLNPNFIKKQLVSNNIYQKIIDNFPEILETTDFFDQESSFLDKKELGDLIRKLISPSWVQAETEKIISNFFDWFLGKNENLDLKINLTDIKPIISQELETTIKNKFNNTSKYQKLDAQNLIENIPDQIDIKAFLEQNRKEQNPYFILENKIKPLLNLILKLLLPILIISIGLLILIAYLSSSSWFKIISSSGLVLLKKSVFILIGVFISHLLSLKFTPLIFEKLGQFPSQIKNEIVVPIVNSIQRGIYNFLYLEIGIVSVLGLVLFITFKILDKKFKILHK